MNLFNFTPRKSHEVGIADTPLGGGNPIRIQSMTTCATTDVEGCIAQTKRIVAAGADYVRLTAQGTLEAKALAPIRQGLRDAGIKTPLVADIHFNPNVADVAATIVEKVRINPGNYVDPARTFKHLEYTDEEYAAELQRLETRFKQLLGICRTHGTAIRIGVNHGSLSDRIMSRYGDTPEGIVESCMEFLRICVKEDFKNVVISIKASNTVVMVRSVRLLCSVMEAEGMDFPLHLGVTEAGEGEDGRIKSAVGIGSLLSDGIGDTIRVSLSEEPEAEIPVARELANYITSTRSGHSLIPATAAAAFDYLRPERRPTRAVAPEGFAPIGGTAQPVVVSFRPDADALLSANPLMRPDYIYAGRELPPADKRVEGVGYIVDADVYRGEAGTFPAFTAESAMFATAVKAPAKFLFLEYLALGDETRACLRHVPEMVVIAASRHANPTGELRALAHELWSEGIERPVVFMQRYALGAAQKETFQLRAAADTGSLLFDLLTDGLCLATAPAEEGMLRLPHAIEDETAFAILQAARLRTSKTEYISCPGCGRTLYDLQTTIARIKAATAHLTGLKIGIMGCIVNGPGEMADADYGYVGAARGKVSLYRGKVCVEKNIPTEEAVDKLLALIESDRKA